MTDSQTLWHPAPSPFVPYQRAQTAFWPHPDQPVKVCASPHAAIMLRGNNKDAGTSCSSIRDITLLVRHKSPRQSIACNLNELQLTVWTSSYNVRGASSNCCKQKDSTVTLKRSWSCMSMACSVTVITYRGIQMLHTTHCTSSARVAKRVHTMRRLWCGVTLVCLKRTSRSACCCCRSHMLAVTSFTCSNVTSAHAASCNTCSMCALSHSIHSFHT